MQCTGTHTHTNTHDHGHRNCHRDWAEISLMENCTRERDLKRCVRVNWKSVCADMKCGCGFEKKEAGAVYRQTHRHLQHLSRTHSRTKCLVRQSWPLPLRKHVYPHISNAVSNVTLSPANKECSCTRSSMVINLFFHQVILWACLFSALLRMRACVCFLCVCRLLLCALPQSFSVSCDMRAYVLALA